MSSQSSDIKHFYLTLVQLEDRTQPAQFRWNPGDNHNWYHLDNWDTKTALGGDWQPSSAIPTGSDTVTFGLVAGFRVFGIPPTVSAPDCIVDNTTYIRGVTFESGYSGTLFLPNNLFIVDPSSPSYMSMFSKNAVVSGGVNAQGVVTRGDLYIGSSTSQPATMNWTAGQLADVNVHIQVLR